jgi:hypothetical protein
MGLFKPETCLLFGDNFVLRPFVYSQIEHLSLNSLHFDADANFGMRNGGARKNFYTERMFRYPKQ